MVVLPWLGKACCCPPFSNSAYFLLEELMTAIGSYTDGHKLLRGTGNPLRPWAFFASQESLFCASAKAEVKVVAQGMEMLNTLGNSMVFFPAGNPDISLLCLDAEQFPQSTYESLPFHSFCLFVCFCGLNKNVDVTLSKLAPPSGCLPFSLLFLEKKCFFGLFLPSAFICLHWRVTQGYTQPASNTVTPKCYSWLYVAAQYPVELSCSEA